MDNKWNLKSATNPVVVAPRAGTARGTVSYSGACNLFDGIFVNGTETFRGPIDKYARQVNLNNSDPQFRGEIYTLPLVPGEIYNVYATAPEQNTVNSDAESITLVAVQ